MHNQSNLVAYRLLLMEQLIQLNTELAPGTKHTITLYHSGDRSRQVLAQELKEVVDDCFDLFPRLMWLHRVSYWSADDSMLTIQLGVHVKELPKKPSRSAHVSPPHILEQAAQLQSLKTPRQQDLYEELYLLHAKAEEELCELVVADKDYKPVIPVPSGCTYDDILAVLEVLAEDFRHIQALVEEVKDEVSGMPMLKLNYTLQHRSKRAGMAQHEPGHAEPNGGSKSRDDGPDL